MTWMTENLQIHLSGNNDWYIINLAPQVCYCCFQLICVRHPHINGVYLPMVALEGSTIVHHFHCSAVQVSLTSNARPSSVYRLSWLMCPLKCACVCACVCPVRRPVLVLSLLCRQEKAEECQPASIQLLLSYWYSGHTEPSWVSVARAKEECGKRGDGERRKRGERPHLSHVIWT